MGEGVTPQGEDSGITHHLSGFLVPRWVLRGTQAHFSSLSWGDRRCAVATNPKRCLATHGRYVMQVKWVSRQSLLHYDKLLRTVQVLLTAMPQGCGPFVIVECDKM